MSPDDAPLVALLSPDGVSGLEVIEHALPAWIRRTLAQAAPAVRTAIRGYAVGHPDGVTLVPHRWFLVGRDRHVFDPTGYQFSRGLTGAQVDLWRYRIDGLPISHWRRLEAARELPPHAAEAGVLWTA